jgi:hypothetical protein
MEVNIVKLKSLGTALCVSMLFAGAASSQSLPQESAQPFPEPVDFVCYMESSNGQIIDLTKVCGTSRIVAPSAPAAATPPATPRRASSALSPETNLGGLNVGGQNGSPLCFGVDAQGRACPFSPVTTQE